MVLAAKKSGVRRFIYASTSSVYGVSKLKDVKEEHPLVPLTLYNKYKGMCEPILFKHTNTKFEGVILDLLLFVVTHQDKDLIYL